MCNLAPTRFSVRFCGFSPGTLVSSPSAGVKKPDASKLPMEQVTKQAV